ncbi:CvpA family protein [Nitrosophilus alvini]|uniref:CvpA family protein n=1 Tax=Nitrosophilus alvini TaxID=2714855 RepID=UPI00190DEBBB|nr:CvpA family protein [Nitrosophilus alvini]
MDGINYFDIAVGALILLLGIKGLIDGFIKEFFGLIGIIGGIYLGSHYAKIVGEFISSNIFHIKNPAALSLVGFLLTLVLFWVLMLMLGKLFAKMGVASGLGAIDKILGAVFGFGKIFLIFSVIVYAVSNVEAARKAIEKFVSDSLLYPVLVKTGSYIIKLNPDEIAQKAKEKIDSNLSILPLDKNETNETIENNTTLE